MTAFTGTLALTFNWSGHPQDFSMTGCTLGQNMHQVCCFGFLILTVQTYTKWIQRLHNSTDMFSTDVRVIRMIALSVHTRLVQRWNKAYVTRQVLGNKHVTTSFRYLTTYKLLESKNTTLPTVLLHKIAFHCSTSLSRTLTGIRTGTDY